MKKRAIIYTRVSTDEQNNGYSPSDQKDKLHRYCENHNIEVVGFYHDDESGKTFNRPEWIKIMRFIRKNKNSVDVILFLKWDRFSRNVAEAYITIRDLRKLGVEAQSIEQPLDFEIPESKIMLSIYLAAPEVDNDRRALNIFHGIRRGKKEGRWLGACLKGYKNTRDANNRPIIAPEGGKMQKLIQKAFSEFATGMYNIEELRRKLNKEGLKASRCPFALMLKNKGYIGKVFIPAYKDEKEYWVDGIHPGIIDEKTFYAVQDILEGRRKKVPNKFLTFRDELPLRGYLICPQCGRNLSGSGSRGQFGNRFFYYHCTNGCKERHPAKEVNAKFEALLQNYVANPQTMKLYAAILKDQFKDKNTSGKSELEKVTQQIAKQKMRLSNAKGLMLDGEFSTEDYKEMKREIEGVIEQLSRDVTTLMSDSENYSSEIDECLDLLLNLNKYYTSAKTETKQRIIGSVFPEKMIFENKIVRTLKVNQVVSLICRNSKDFEGGEKKKNPKKSGSSRGVESEGFEPSSKQGIKRLSTKLSVYLIVGKQQA